jgi:hypothetical protein
MTDTGAAFVRGIPNGPSRGRELLASLPEMRYLLCRIGRVVPRVNTGEVKTARARSPISFPDICVAQADETERFFLALGRTNRFDKAMAVRRPDGPWRSSTGCSLHGLDDPGQCLMRATDVLHDIEIPVRFRGHHRTFWVPVEFLTHERMTA